MNNWDCSPLHSSAAVGKRVNTFRFYTGHYARPGSSLWMRRPGVTFPSDQCERAAVIGRRPGAPRRRIHADPAGTWSGSGAPSLPELRRCAAAFCKTLAIWCERARIVPSRAMMVIIITTADWWRRGDNYCADDGDDECFTMMLMIITIVVLFLLPSVSRRNTPGKGCLSLPLLLVVYVKNSHRRLFSRAFSRQRGGWGWMCRCSGTWARSDAVAGHVSAAPSVTIIRSLGLWWEGGGYLD